MDIQYGGLQADFDNLKAQLDEEAENAAALKSQLQKSQAEYQTIKSKYDKEVSAKSDELDELRSAQDSVKSNRIKIKFSSCKKLAETVSLTCINFHRGGVTGEYSGCYATYSSKQFHIHIMKKFRQQNLRLPL